MQTLTLIQLTPVAEKHCQFQLRTTEELFFTVDEGSSHAVN